MSNLATHSDHEEFLKEYMPVAEFSANKNISEEKIIGLIRDGSYSGRIKNGLWFVRRDELIKKTVEKPVADSAPTNIFSKLLRGHYGLGFTFWVWGVCGGFVFGSLLLMPIAGGEIEILVAPCILIWFSYITMVFIGMWRSEKSFSFSSIVSKLFIVATFCTLGLVLLYILAMLTSHYPNH